MDVEVIRERLYKAINSIGSEESLEMMVELGSKVPDWLRLHLQQDHTIPSPSRLLDCRYQLWCHSKGYDPDQDVPISWKIRQVAGILQEPYWIHIFSLAGFDVELPAETYDCGPHMQAHPDALLGANDALEFKSTTGIGFRKLTDSYGVSTEYYNHYMQAQLYLFAAQKERCLYFATTPDPGLLQSTLRQKKRYGPTFELEPIYLEWIERDESTIKEGLERAELIASDAESDEPAPKEFSGQTHSRQGKRIFPCLAPRQKVLTEKGWRDIKHLVYEKSKLHVATVLPDQTIGWRRINAWYVNPRSDRKFLHVALENAFAGTLTKGVTGVIVTDDHEFLTTNGWVQAKDLTTQDLVATGEVEPNKQQKQILDGSLLGDGCALGTSGFCVQQTQHAQIRLKAVALKDLGVKLSIVVRAPPRKDKLSINAPKRIWTRELRRRWYDNTGKKHVPRDLVLTDLLLAVWYMDDGSLHTQKGTYAQPQKSMRFATNGFVREDVEYLSALLKEQGINCWVGKKRTISVSIPTTHLLTKRIGRFIPPEMRYKLPADAPPFDSNVWCTGKANMAFRSPTVKPAYDSSKRTWVYCLGVEETENFITRGGVVHNCGYCPFAERCNEVWGYGEGLGWER